MRLGADEVDGDARILVTIHRISFGGADRIAILLVNALVDAGFAVRLAILRDGGEGEAALLKLLDARVELRRAGPPLRSRHLELVRGYRFLQREIADWQPRIVLASSNNMGLVTGLAARRTEGWHGRLAMKFTNPVIRPRDWGAARVYYRKRLYHFVLGHYDRVLTISDGEHDTLCRLYPDYAPRIATVPNPYVTDAMLESARAAPEGRPPRIVTLARLMPQKRIDRLLDAFAEMATPKAELVIVGDGPLRGELEHYTAALGLAHRVRFTGFAEDVLPWLVDADLFALSSDYEGCPAAVLEALACGLPVVSTNCFEGAHALLGKAAGCTIVPRTDFTRMARAMEATLRDRTEPPGLRALAHPYRFDRALAAHVEALAALL